jgi:acid phosphatase (class A)
MRMRSIVAAGGLIVLIACAAAALTPPSSYLAGHEPDVLAAIPPPPSPGSPRDQADRAIFRRTRALEGTPRWALARSDADETVLLSDFSCALGVTLSSHTAPRLDALLNYALPDIEEAVRKSKTFYRKLRPFTRDRGPICVARSPGFAQSFDYPSGHATRSWTYGLILARLAPDRAGQILGRARAYGDSRIVCGVHNASAVAAGRVGADTVVAALSADPRFQSDLAAARDELTGLRAHGPKPDAAVCAADTKVLAAEAW